MAEKLFLNSEEKFEDFCDNANDLMQSVTPEARFRWVNKAWLKTLGYDEKQIANMTLFDVIHPDELEHCQYLFKKVVSGEDVGRITTAFVTKDGNKIYMEGEVNIELSHSKVIYTRAIFRDITERKRAEETSKESEEKFSRAFHSNPHPMSIVTLAEGRYLDVNGSYVQTFGFSREELLGRTTVEMGILKNNRARRKILQSLKKRQAINNLEVEFQTRSGQKIDALLSADKTEIGGQTCLLSVITDITERKQAEDAIRESEERYRTLLELNAEVGEAVVMLQNTEDKKAVHTFATEEWSRITGYSREELFGMSWFDLLRPDYRQAALERFQRRIGGEALLGLFESYIVRKDGTEVPIEITASSTTYRGKFALVIYARDITEPKKAEQERIQLIQELQETLKEVRTLSGLLPICAWCKKLRDDEGYWKSVEQFIGERTKAEFTHGMCPECQSKFFSEKNSNTKVS